MPTDAEAADLEAIYWKPTGELRRWMPKHGHDDDARLQMLWERVTGEREWRDIPLVFEV